MTAVTDLHEWARFYIDRFGWALAPVWLNGAGEDGTACQCPDGVGCDKPGRHLVSGAGVAREIDDIPVVFDVDRIGKGFALAALTGSESRLLVIDVRDDGPITRARFGLHGGLVQHTPTHGQHWFYQLEEGRPVYGGRTEIEIVEDAWVLGDGTWVALGPREGYRWDGGTEALRDEHPGPVPTDLTLYLATKKLIEPTEELHRDDPWLSAAGHPPKSGRPRSYTRTGDILRLVDHYGDRLLFTPGLGVKVWTESGWQGGDRAMSELSSMTLSLSKVHFEESRVLHKKGEDSDAKEALKWSSRTRMRATAGLVGDLAGDRRILVPDVSYWDTDGALVGLPDVAGRVLDLRTSKVARAEQVNQRRRRVSKRMGAVSGGESLAYWWERAHWFPKYVADMTRAQGEDWMRLLRRACGASLFGRGQVPDALFVLQGPPRSGKSTIAECLNAVAGSYSKALNSSLLFGTQGSQEFQIAALIGLRVAIIGEPDTDAANRALNVETLKGLTGGDEQTGRAPYGKAEISFYPELSLWVVANHPLQHTDEAVWRRTKPFVLEHPPVWSDGGEDPRLRHALLNDPTEKSCALAWFLTGAQEYAELQETGEGWGPEASIWTEAVRDMKSALDPFDRFINETLTHTGSPVDEFAVDAVMAAFRTWLAGNPEEKVVMKGSTLRTELVHRIGAAGFVLVHRPDRFQGGAITLRTWIPS